MANREQGEVGITVGDKVYTLRPTFDALCELEELVNKPVNELLAGIEQGRLSGLRAVVWCFLQDQHADEFKTLKDASRWIEEVGGVDQVKGLIEQALQVNAPPASKGEKTRRPRKTQAGSGRRSSSALAATG